MEQDTKNNDAFADWIFDEFVINERKYGKEARVYLTILTYYIKLGLLGDNQIEQRKYAEKLYKIIMVAIRDMKTHLLLLRGEGAVKDFEQSNQRNEERWRTIGVDEQSIKELTNEKLRLNDGNDIF